MAIKNKALLLAADAADAADANAQTLGAEVQGCLGVCRRGCIAAQPVVGQRAVAEQLGTECLLRWRRCCFRQAMLAAWRRATVCPKMHCCSLLHLIQGQAVLLDSLQVILQGR